MQLSALFLLAPALVQATLNKSTSNTKGKCPKSYNCSPTITTKTDIQAAECAFNTRTHKTQTFAVFKTNHAEDSSHGAPYGPCSAYTCESPTDAEMIDDADCWTFFWSGHGESNGAGLDCIKDPKTGVCGCENSDGNFIPGRSDCK
ncbi:hypothetical protein CORC01_03519 [Colletotrichum orchidophilum]|uniref:Small secreted protein n=1 Tax=Colletotrichum orchidophilum TaxID=1209926 RepID=A0A1G4BIF9_9PEZI|nr:uncharacterized protein CORC01_03519 [Colletotrichum orchidophilum]OHF01204.1 hypothetical protein CORC01_03519 [Colletotrichum orchidophilum]